LPVESAAAATALAQSAGKKQISRIFIRLLNALTFSRR
jgi:hypothetical protein